MLIICYVQVCKVISYIIPFKPQQCMQNRYCFNLILQIRRVELRGSENFRHFPKVSNIRLLISCAFNILTLQKRKLRLGKVEEKRAPSGSGNGPLSGFLILTHFLLYPGAFLFMPSDSRVINRRAF